MSDPDTPALLEGIKARAEAATPADPQAVRKLAERLQGDCVIDTDGDIRIADHGEFLRATAVVVALSRAYLAERQAREEAESRYREEYAIVDRCWRALGVTSYDAGPAIDERIAALRAALADLRSRLAAQDAALTAIAVRQYQGGQA